MFLVETAPAAITFADDAKGKALRANLPGRGRDLVKAPGSVHELSLRMPAPERSSPAIAALRGTVVVTGASKLLTFTFDKLRETGPKHKGEAQTRERVRVQLLDISRETDPDRFSFEVSIANPPAGPRFESHESAAGAWMAHNAIWLENKRTRQRLQPNRLTEDVAREARYAVVRYDFMQRDNPGVRFGQLSDWVLYYRTPGRMVEVTVPYEFKNVPLP